MFAKATLVFGRIVGGVLSQFLRFGLVGIAGFFVDVAVLYLALSLLGVGPYAGRGISYVVAASFTWYFNRRLTFADRRSDAAGREWGTFVVINAVGGALNYAAYAAFLHHFGSSGVVPAVGVALGSLAGLIANFTLSRQVVFRKPRPAVAGGSSP